MLRRNLETTGLAVRAEVVTGDAFAYLARPGLPAFRLVYIAPPQYHGVWLRALLAVDARPELLEPDGQAVIRIFPKEWLEPELVHLSLFDRRQYGSTALCFFGRREGS